MAEFSINPRFAETLQRTAGARIARAVYQRLSPTGIKRLQQIVQVADFAQGALGLGTDFDNAVQPLLGGVTMQYAKEIYSQLNEARLTRKNLFFVEMSDPNPPDLGYASIAGGLSPENSKVGDIIDMGRRAITGGLGGLISEGLGAALPGIFGAGGGARGGDQPSVGQLFNLFATSASYAPNTLIGEKIAFGSAMMDRLTGMEAVELQLTTMDDEVGTLKRWFDGKCLQAANLDGTFGLPGDYLVDISIFHAIPKPDDRSYRFHAKMRPQNIQHDLARGEQTMQELQMTFTQFDTFYPV